MCTSLVCINPKGVVNIVIVTVTNVLFVYVLVWNIFYVLNWQLWKIIYRICPACAIQLQRYCSECNYTRTVIEFGVSAEPYKFLNIYDCRALPNFFNANNILETGSSAARFHSKKCSCISVGFKSARYICCVPIWISVQSGQKHRRIRAAN